MTLLVRVVVDLYTQARACCKPPTPLHSRIPLFNF